MNSILDRIVAYKRQEIAAARARMPDAQLETSILTGAAPAVRGEVVYDNGRYLLFGDGVRQPWQWVWVPANAPSPPPPPR